MRLTKEIVAQILLGNEGYKDKTYYESRNKKEENYYEIIGGKLMKRSVGRTSWGGSQYDETYECDIDQTRRFLRERAKVFNIE